MQLSKPEVEQLYREALESMVGRHYLVQFQSDANRGLKGRLIEANAIFLRFTDVELVDHEVAVPTDAVNVVVFRDNIDNLQAYDPATVVAG